MRDSGGLYLLDESSCLIVRAGVFYQYFDKKKKVYIKCTMYIKLNRVTISTITERY